MVMMDACNQETGEQVLIVDDEPANVNVLSDLLESRGYRILAATSGEIALRIAEAAQPQIILLDVILPGIDGHEACRRLSANEATADIPVLFISARDEAGSIVEGFSAGGLDYITKPFQLDEVL